MKLRIHRTLAAPALIALGTALSAFSVNAAGLFLDEAPNDYTTLSSTGVPAGPGGPITELFEEGTTDYDGSHGLYAESVQASGERVEFAVFEPAGPSHPWDIVPQD